MRREEKKWREGGLQKKRVRERGRKNEGRRADREEESVVFFNVISPDAVSGSSW